VAKIVGYFGMSHGPQLMLKPDQWSVVPHRVSGPLPEIEALVNESLETRWAKWDRCHAAIGSLRERLAALEPDTVVLIGDDQRENLLDDCMPPFTVFTGDQVDASTSLTYFKEPWENNRRSYTVNQPLARYLVDQLMEQGFDPAYAQKTRFAGGLGHAFARPLKFIEGERFRVLPIMVNTYFPPAPSPKRCADFGRALASLIDGYDGSERVVMIASGGLSHTKIDEQLDRDVLQAIERNDLAFLEGLPATDLLEGTSEIRNWIVVAAAANRGAEVLEYQPLYRTPTGIGCAMAFAAW
jgi:3-O-methylgallate 3,4-dioxygenase